MKYREYVKKGLAVVLSTSMIVSLFGACGKRDSNAGAGSDFSAISAVSVNDTSEDGEVIDTVMTSSDSASGDDVVADAALTDLAYSDTADVTFDEEPASATNRSVDHDGGFITGSSKGNNTADENIAANDTNQSADTDIVNLIIDSKNASESADAAGTASGTASSSDDYTDADGGLTVPFDIAYPDEFYSEDVVYSENTILVKTAPGFDGRLTKSLQDAGIGEIDEMFATDNGTWYTAYIYEDADIYETMDAVRELNYVVTAEYNYVYETADYTVDYWCGKNPRYDREWHLWRHHLPECWEEMDEKEDCSAGGSTGVVVAVIDTGVDYDHIDLKANMWKNADEIPDNGIDDDGNGYVDDYYGIDMTAGKGNGDDDQGHGTHVAGIIAATNNQEGVVGIAYNTKIMTVKAGDASGYFLQSNIAKAIIYAYNEGADVINMSFGGSECSIAVQDALRTAYNRCVLVASAGNDGMPNEGKASLPNYPAALSYVIGVMSVGEDNVESSFTNYDVILYSNTEYEVYAPGEQILSTVPGDNYAVLSGTSMAAPVVSAQAALLRSYYSDRNTYPTKFIYGQIVGTATESVTCCDPEHHGTHNIPGVINFYEALTLIPTPDISVSDYTIFDSTSYTADTEGVASDSADYNNGDGVIDAGEILALGVTLRNRWGMGSDVTVSIDANSSVAGYQNNYVTFLNNNISYGSVGTYSENDSGKVYDGDKWTGWEKPFYIKVSKDCPNDYTITFNVTTTYKNGLNSADTTAYSNVSQIVVIVRNGVILPNNITEDMTLTADQLYIIPNATLIAEGATVTAEPGTKIQFWCSKATDAYADTGIAYLKVEGKFICNGTEDEPVELFPSDWMGKYRVELYYNNNGYVELNHTVVTNPYITVQKAENCEFKQNFSSNLYYRELYNGNVKTYYYGNGLLSVDDANNCALYKCYNLKTKGSYDTCIFIDSYNQYNTNGNTIIDVAFKNCVFYGNKNKGGVSTFTTDTSQVVLSSVENFYDSTTGTIYLLCNGYTNSYYKFILNIEVIDALASLLGGKIAVYEDDAEYERVCARFGSTYVSRTGIYNTGATYGYTYAVIEIPGNVLVESISLNDYLVSLDMESQYQIVAYLTPSNASGTLIYESMDESVATVSETGMVTPIGTGSTEIKVYSPDYAVSNYLTVNVNDAVGLEAMQIKQDDFTLSVGAEKSLGIAYTPVNTTKRIVAYSSSDESVATVDASGRVKGISAGTAVITAIGYGNLTDTVTVTVVIPATGISFAKQTYSTTLSGGDEKADYYPVITPSDCTQTDITWQSADPSICYVDDNGNLVKLAEGSTTLKSTVTGTDYSAELKVVVSNNISHDKVVKMIYGSGNSSGIHYYALMDNGYLWVWGGDKLKPVKLSFGDGIDGKIKDFMVYDYYSTQKLSVLLNDGTVRYITNYFANASVYTVPISNIISLADEIYDGDGSFYAIDNDGNVYVWGSNNRYRLGLSSGISSVSYDSPKLMELGEAGKIENIVSTYYGAILLDEARNAFIVGYSKYTEAYKIAEDIMDIYKNANKNYCSLKSLASQCFYINYDGVLYTLSSNNCDYEAICDYCYSIKNGEVSIKGYNDYGQLGINSISSSSTSTFNTMLGITNAEKVYVFMNNIFIQCSDDSFYSTGEGSKNALGTGSTDNALIPQEVIWGAPSAGTAVVSDTNFTTSDAACVLSSDSINLTFNGELSSSAYYSGIELKDSDSNLIGLSKVIDFNKLTLTPVTTLTDGSTYTLTIPAKAVVDAFGNANADITYTFTYQKPENQSEGDDLDPYSVVHESVTDADKDAERRISSEDVMALWNELQANGFNGRFYCNAILNRLGDDTVSNWLRIEAPSSSTYTTINLGYNYWGTTDETLINKQILDFDDYQSLADINEGTVLTAVPEENWPVVTSAYLQVGGETVSTVGNEEVTFVVEFNRDMDTTIPLSVAFGSADPYCDYTVSGSYETARKWIGTLKLTTIIENGYEYFSISNGKAAGTSMKLYTDWGRFSFKIDTSSAQALIMQAEATDTGINLTWTQDDFDTLAGYNVYRATSKDGQYTKLNRTVIPADTKTWFDDTVEPGQLYYYNFTVVKTDMTESEPSGKISLTAKDTMAPNIYHSPVYEAFAGNNLVISATVTDNVAISAATLYYRITGETDYIAVAMSNNNDKYSALIGNADVTTAGLEYYIEATDGVSYTYKGNAEAPYQVTVKESVDDSELGDVDGNGAIELKDALMLLQAINDRLNLDTEQFARADINGNGTLEAKEALRIIQYVNGSLTSVLY